jgi:hypothetical protein
LALGVACGKIGYDLDDEEPKALDGNGADASAGAGGSIGTYSTDAPPAKGSGGASDDADTDARIDDATDGGVGDETNDGDATGDASDATDASADAGASCPMSISLRKPTPTGRHGWMGGNSTVYTDICPNGQVVVGYVLYDSVNPSPESIGRIQTLCGTVAITGSPCRVTISPGATMPLRGRFSDRPPVTQRCPPDQMVVAFRGRSSGEVIQIAFGCASLTLSPGPLGPQTSIGPVTWFPPVGGPSGTPFTDGCSGGDVATGSDIYSQYYIDAFGLYCSTPVVTP